MKRYFVKKIGDNSYTSIEFSPKESISLLEELEEMGFACYIDEGITNSKGNRDRFLSVFFPDYGEVTVKEFEHIILKNNKFFDIVSKNQLEQEFFRVRDGILIPKTNPVFVGEIFNGNPFQLDLITKELSKELSLKEGDLILCNGKSLEIKNPYDYEEV